MAVRFVQWSPDGKRIDFLQKRGDKDKVHVCALPLEGPIQRLNLSDPCGVS